MIKDIGIEGQRKTSAMTMCDMLKPGQRAMRAEPRNWHIPMHTQEELYGNKNIKDKG